MADKPPPGYLLWETYGLRDNTYTGERSLVRFYTLTELEADPPDTDRILQELADPMSQQYPQQWVERYHHKVIGRLSRSFYDSILFQKWLRFMARWGGFVPARNDATDDPRLVRQGESSIMTKRELIQVLEAMPCPDKNLDLITQFNDLADIWQRETAHQSNMTKRAIHPAYQRIIGMGPAIVSFILERFRNDVLEDWFWALTAMTGENPITEDIAGDIEKMAKAWVQWGTANGYLTDSI